MENYAFSSKGVPGQVGSVAQASAGFLNEGGKHTSFNDWKVGYDHQIEKLGKAVHTLEARSDRTRQAIPKETIDSVRNLISLLQAQAPVIERAFQLIEMPDAWEEQDLAQAADFSENRLPKSHTVAKRLRERREIEINIAQVQELLLDISSAASDNAALLERWEQLFRTHKQKSHSPLRSPALLRSKDLLILTWAAAINGILVGAKTLLEQASWENEQRTQAQELVSMIEIAEGNLAVLTNDTATAFEDTSLARQHLNDRLHDRSISPMSNNDTKKTFTGNATGSTPPSPPPPPPTPPNKPADGPPSDEHATMEHYTKHSLTTAEDVKAIAKLAKPFLDGSRQPANKIEQEFVEQVELLVAEVVDPLIERTAVAGRITRVQLNEAISQRELLLAAVEQFRGPEAAKQVSECLDKESLKLQATNLLSAPKGSWYDSNLEEARQLTEHPLMQGTPLQQELIERIADEKRIANDARDAEHLVHTTTWTPDDAAKAQALVDRKLLAPSVIETLRQRLTPPPAKTPTPPPPPPPKKPKTTDTVVLSKADPSTTPWWKNTWLNGVAGLVALVALAAIVAYVSTPIIRRWQRTRANQAAIAAAQRQVPTTPPEPQPAPQTEPPAPAEPAAPQTEPPAPQAEPPAPSAEPTVAPAPAPANPPANEPTPASANTPTERALTRADFGGHPIDRVPDDALPRGSWIGAHLRCATPPTTNNNGETDYRTCRYVE